MTRSIVIAIVIGLLIDVLCSNLYAQTHPAWSVVRIPSHGCSGVVIRTGQGGSLVLTCAHAFQGAGRSRPVALDVPATAGGQTRSVGTRILACDYAADLVVIAVPAPLPAAIDIAAEAPRPGETLYSLGFGAMRFPVNVWPTRCLRVETTSGGPHSFEAVLTTSPPTQGMSGGLLLDSSGRLCGITHGYFTVPGRTPTGIYVGPGTIRRLLGSAQAPRPAIVQQQQCPT